MGESCSVAADDGLAEVSRLCCSQAAGLATMIAAMRPDIDNIDEYVRNTTARAFSVVASALGIPALLPFLKAVCQSKKSWQARHTGIKIVQQISILMGCAVLPHLKASGQNSTIVQKQISPVVCGRMLCQVMRMGVLLAWN